MKHIAELVSSLPNKEWLFVGKGPTLCRWKDEYKDQYNVIGINEAANFIRSDIMHISDYDIFTGIRHIPHTVIASGVLNWRRKSNSGTLLDFMHDYRLRDLSDEGKLYSYDVQLVDGWSTNLFPETHRVMYKYASGVMLTQLATSWEQETIYTLGIDGGTDYCSSVDGHHSVGIGLFTEQVNLMNQIAKENSMEIIKL